MGYRRGSFSWLVREALTEFTFTWSSWIHLNSFSLPWTNSTWNWVPSRKRGLNFWLQIFHLLSLNTNMWVYVCIYVLVYILFVYIICAIKVKQNWKLAIFVVSAISIHMTWPTIQPPTYPKYANINMILKSKSNKYGL